MMMMVRRHENGRDDSNDDDEEKGFPVIMPEDQKQFWVNVRRGGILYTLLTPRIIKDWGIPNGDAFFQDNWHGIYHQTIRIVFLIGQLELYS